MDRDIQNMGRASRGEGRREGEGNTNGHSSGAGHEKESRTSQWTVIAGGRGEGARRGGVHRPPGARCRMEPGGRGRRGRRPDPRVAAAERVQEGSRERGAGGELNTHTRRKKGGKRGGESEQAGRQRQRTHTPAGKAKPSGKPKADREGCGAGWPRDVPRRCESWGKPGRTGDHPKSRGGPSGSRLPRSPPPPPPPASKPQSPLLPGAAARPRGTAAAPRRAGGLPGLGPGPRPAGNFGGERRALPRRPAGLRAPGRPGGEASGVSAARRRRAREAKPQERGGKGEQRGGGTSQLSPPASLARLPGAPLPGRLSEPCPQPAPPNESETRDCRRRSGGLAPGEGGEAGGAAAAGGTEKWLELGGCGGGGCNFAENGGRDAEAAGTGREQVAGLKV
ncbi:collagen alpha-1(I) chain-like isoform X2 [Falco cherrug]|uniref:collagen alpha-1(I) chain-like isoform X2 n=1 Tax=Falco cherrug TaxID=345164 RepID=UPI002479F816|nr:collagen alpha-1(I) chain-like isoform X2 [Falco cherrug]